MCANYSLPLFSDYRLYYQAPQPEFEPKAEAFPGYSAAMLIRSEERRDEKETLRAVFGLIPHWARDTKITRMTYNSRSETAGKLPSFRDAWKAKRWCLVPASAIYEPNYESGKPERWRIHRRDGRPFAIAGIWGTWRKGEEPIRSFSMLTINADEHPLMKRFHAQTDEKRSVVLLGPEQYDQWLDAADEDEARELLLPFNADEFTAEPAPLKRRTKVAPAGESGAQLL